MKIKIRELSDTVVSVVKTCWLLVFTAKKGEYLGDFCIGCNEVKTQGEWTILAF